MGFSVGYLFCGVDLSVIHSNLVSIMLGCFNLIVLRLPVFCVWGGFRISGKGVHMYKRVGVRFADLSHCSEITYENETTWSH